jgi:hypothetical protein
MEVSENVKNYKDASKFISRCFVEIGPSYKNPIFPYKINFRSDGLRFTFCGLPVIECWAFKQDQSFTFFILLKNGSNIMESISEVYGNHDIESSVEINDNPSISKSYAWHKKHLNIVLQKYFNIWGTTRFDNCAMATIGNMEYSSIFNLSYPQ